MASETLRHLRDSNNTLSVTFHNSRGKIFILQNMVHRFSIQTQVMFCQNFFL